MLAEVSRTSDGPTWITSSSSPTSLLHLRFHPTTVLCANLCIYSVTWSIVIGLIGSGFAKWLSVSACNPTRATECEKWTRQLSRLRRAIVTVFDHKINKRVCFLSWYALVSDLYIFSCVNIRFSVCLKLKIYLDLVKTHVIWLNLEYTNHFKTDIVRCYCKYFRHAKESDGFGWRQSSWSRRLAQRTNCRRHQTDVTSAATCSAVDPTVSL